MYEVARDAYSKKYCDPFERVIFPHEGVLCVCVCVCVCVCA